MAGKVAISDPVDSRPHDYFFEVVLIGSNYVGKTSLVSRFHYDEFRFDVPATIGVDFFIRNMYLGGEVIKVEIWDTAGQERFRTTISSFLCGTHGVLLVYSINRSSTFDDLQDWLFEVKRHDDPNVVVMLVGTKCDCEGSREVTTQEALDFTNRNAMSFFETSAKESINVDTVFAKLSTDIYYKRDILKIPRVNPSLTIAPELLGVRNPVTTPTERPLTGGNVESTQQSKQSPVTADTSDSSNCTTSPLDEVSETDFNEKCPSNVGVLGILEHIPLWYDLAVKLGVPIAHVGANRLDLAMGGKHVLSYWRDGRCGGAFPNTWEFLLETVENLHGPLVAKKLRDEAERDKTWS